MISLVEKKYFPLSPILLFGVNGQVGCAVREAFSQKGVSLIGLTREKANFEQPESLRAIIRHFKPSIIINAAAYTAVDKSEKEVELATIINTQAPGVLAEEAEILGACLVHYSTDYVFDGKKNSPYIENDIPNPLSVYGRTKYQGERLVADRCQKHIIFRTSWVFHHEGNNFLKTILRLGADRESLSIVADQYGAPTSAGLIAEVTFLTLTALQEAFENDIRWGMYHLTAEGETTWYGYAKYIISIAFQLGFPLKVRESHINPILASEYQLAAQRPVNSRLKLDKLKALLNITLPEWKKGIEEVLVKLVKSDGVIR
jgi:dTDP-4-dehydrorhamnose reductase